MAFQLTGPEIENAFAAIEHHGYSALLPTPPEWEVVRERWADICPKITALDLDEYKPHAPLRMYAPKSRATVRAVSLLHPIDLIIYTALTLIARDDLEAARVPANKHRVFSYRAHRQPRNRLYGSQINFNAFIDRSRAKASAGTTKVVAVADIADFYPRIYQHRLENVIEASARSERVEQIPRVLVKKLISNLSGQNSYGIPVGPYASRILGEAVLIDVDATLLGDRVDFVRWVDDYSIFCRSEAEAQRVLFRLAEHLFENHGLTLSALKTKILSPQRFRDRLLRHPRAIINDRVAVLSRIAARFDPYEDDEPEISAEEMQELEEVSFPDVLEEALADRSLVDYETVSAILNHPGILERLTSETRESIADTLLANLEHLYPVAEEVSQFLQTFSTAPRRLRSRVRAGILRSMEPHRGEWPPDYHLVWMLTVFATSRDWGERSELLQIFRTHRSDAVRRFAALALHATGSRSQAVAIKGDWQSASPMT